MAVSGTATAAVALMALSALSVCVQPAAARESTIQSFSNGSTFSVSVHSDVHAGAIDSLIFRGVQYVDNFDHGRQIQTAVQVDDLGECFNPTEAGSKADAAKSITSSKTLSQSNEGNVLTTETQAAFWLSPREPYGSLCSRFRSEDHAQNEEVLSKYKIARSTRFYGEAIPNLLVVDVSVTMPENRRSAVIESLTGYLPGAFRAFYSYDPASRRLERLQAERREHWVTTSVIVATLDGRNAMGVFSPQVWNGDPTRDFYSYFYFPGRGATAKWSCRFGEIDVKAGSILRYSSVIAVGSLEEVAAAFDAYVKATPSLRR